MQRDPRTYLWDARHAAQQIVTFTDGRDWADYQVDAMLRSAVERQFEIVGEALNRLNTTEPQLAAQIPDLPRIVAFRNLLIHGYATIDDALVWEVATERVHPLILLLDDMLENSNEQS